MASTAYGSAARPTPFKAAPLPILSPASCGYIRFLHPGYGDNANTLLALRRIEESATGGFGVHFETALVACQIIANNAFGGRLALDQSGKRTVDAPADGVLMEAQYYFFVDKGPTTYPVVPSFSDWEFPHDTVPESWWQTYFPPRVFDNRCVVTNYSWPTDSVHLPPRFERGDWFSDNAMYEYEWDNESRGSSRIMVRRDIRALFDQGHITIVPKMDPATSKYAFVVHVLSPGGEEYSAVVHNVVAQHLPRPCVPFLFAHFAWSVFRHAEALLKNGASRVVRIRADKNSASRINYETKMLPSDQLRDGLGSSAGSLSSSVTLQAFDGSQNEHNSQEQAHCFAKGSQVPSVSFENADNDLGGDGRWNEAEMFPYGHAAGRWTRVSHSPVSNFDPDPMAGLDRQTFLPFGPSADVHPCSTLFPDTWLV